jgi:3-phenylpropionate/trans-cinnamate dioxygenase ferredoxin component
LAKVRVATTTEVPVESLKRVVADHQEICLAHAEDGNFYAIGDVCTHEEFLLSQGELFGMNVECPQHGSRFNLQTGKVTGLPAVVAAKTFAVTVEGSDIFVEVPD